MLKKYTLTLFFTIFCFCTIGLSAGNTQVALRAAYFHSGSDRIKDVYEQNIPLYQIEFSSTLCNNWSIWTNVGYLSKDGHSTYLNDSTHMNFLPIGLGLKKCFSLCHNLTAYFGAGSSYSLIHIHNHTSHVHQHIKKKSLGYMLKSGVSYPLFKNFSAELFCDYIYNKYRYNVFLGKAYRKELSMEGLLFGISAKYSF